MIKYPKRIKTIKRAKKTKRIKTAIDIVEPGRVRVTITKKPRKKKK